jgi:hypothetical protein
MKEIKTLEEGSLTSKLFRTLGKIGGFGSPLPSQKKKQPHVSVQQLNIKAYLSVGRRLQEIQAEKAMLIWESRHDKWKAGGPV